MSISTATAIKASLESAGLGVPVFRDKADEKQRPPYITVTEAISINAEVAFNAYDDPERHVSELAQIDVWQTYRDTTTRQVVENYTLADAVARALDGTGLPTAPTHVSGARLLSMVRLLETDANIVHHSLTVEIRRTLTPIAA